MKKALKQTLALGFGVSKLTQQKVNKFVNGIMKKQGISEKQAKKLAKDMLKKSQETQQKVTSLLVNYAGSIFRAAGLATKKDVEDLKKQFSKMKRRSKNRGR